MTNPLVRSALARPVFLNGRFYAQSMSGVQRFATEITAALAYAWPRNVALPTLLLPADSPVRDYPFPVRRIGRRAGSTWEQVDLPRHARGGLLISLGNVAPLLSRRQIVVIHDTAVYVQPTAYSRAFCLWYRFLQPSLVRGGAKVATVSEFSRQELAARFGIQPEMISVLSEGCEHILRAAPDPGTLARHELVPHRYVLVVGNLAAHKNLAAVSTTAQALAARGLVLVITGGFDHSVFAAQSSLPEPARYVGRVSDAELRALYNSALCFLFPSRYEGFGLPALEAMACGCPVVLANIPALREVGGDAARFCDPASPDAIAEVVCSLADDPAVASSLAELGKTRAANFTWPSAATRLRDLIVATA